MTKVPWPSWPYYFVSGRRRRREKQDEEDGEEKSKGRPSNKKAPVVRSSELMRYAHSFGAGCAI